MLPPNDFPAAPPARHLPAELLRRYVAGELSATQEHTVEAHTLECEQCTEVLEGLEMQPAAVTDASLAALRQRLRARVAELADEDPAGAVVRPLWWRPLAAAALLLFTLGTVAWLVLRPIARPEIAARSAPAAQKAPPATNPATGFDGAAAPAEPPVTAEPPASADVAAVAPPTRFVEPLEPDPPIMNSTRSGERAGQVAAEAEVAAADAAEEKAPVMPTVDAGTADVVSAQPSASYATAAPSVANQTAKRRRTAEPAETARAPRAAAAPVAVAPLAGRTVRGRIVDTAGQPLPGATVLVPGSGAGVSTGTDGRFALSLPPGSRQLAISSIGYTTQTRFLQASDSTLTLALAPDSKRLSEVVVRRESPPSVLSIGPLPAGGFPAFRQYLHDSLDYPEKARDKHLEGYVRLQFVVGTDGKLTDIKVVSKLSPECDEEAIRLLKEGPAWFPGVQRNRRTAREVELKVPFSLEKR